MGFAFLDNGGGYEGRAIERWVELLFEALTTMLQFEVASKRTVQLLVKKKYEEEFTQWSMGWLKQMLPALRRWMFWTPKGTEGGLGRNER